MELCRIETPSFQISAWLVSYPFKDYYRGDLKNMLVMLKCFSSTDVALKVQLCPSWIMDTHSVFFLLLQLYLFPRLPSPTLNPSVDNVKTIFSSAAAASGWSFNIKNLSVYIPNITLPVLLNKLESDIRMLIGKD